MQIILLSFLIHLFVPFFLSIIGAKNIVRYTEDLASLFHLFVPFFYLSIIGAKNIFRYTEDFAMKRFFKSRFQFIFFLPIFLTFLQCLVYFYYCYYFLVWQWQLSLSKFIVGEFDVN